jgi:hypothetical protein
MFFEIHLKVTRVVKIHTESRTQIEAESDAIEYFYEENPDLEADINVVSSVILPRNAKSVTVSKRRKIVGAN